MKLALLVGLGGFTGSICRYLLNLSFLRLYPVAFPLGTFTVNMVGSLLLGVIYALAEYHKIMSHEMRLFLAVGFCGSFTTYSTFALEGLQLLYQKDYFVFFAYTFASLLFGLLFAAAGYFLTQRFI